MFGLDQLIKRKYRFRFLFYQFIFKCTHLRFCFESARVYQEVSRLRMDFLIMIGAWESRVVERVVNNSSGELCGMDRKSLMKL